MAGLGDLLGGYGSDDEEMDEEDMEDAGAFSMPSCAWSL